MSNPPHTPDYIIDLARQHNLREWHLMSLREMLADIEHRRWADWQEYCHTVLREHFNDEGIEQVLARWDRQIKTSYDELSDEEKESDREQVDRYLEIVVSFLVNEADAPRRRHD